MVKGKLVQKYLPADYADCFHKDIQNKKTILVDDLFRLVFMEYPKCIMTLMKIRDILVKPLGLKSGISFDKLIMERNNEEIILGKEDNHLSFVVSVYSSNHKECHQLLSISTVVKYNNFIGRMYFAAIWIFHKMVVGYLFRRAVKSILNG